MTRSDSDGEKPGWRIRRAKPSATGPLLVLVALAAVIFGGAGYVLGRSGKDDAPKQAVAPTATAPMPTQGPPITPTLPPLVLPPTQAPPPTIILSPPAVTPTISGNSGGPGTTPNRTPEAAAAPRLTVTAVPGQTAAPVQATYTVLPGDTAFGIAAKLNVPQADQPAWVNDLLRINNVTAAELQPQKVLTLPPNTPPLR